MSKKKAAAKVENSKNKKQQTAAINQNNQQAAPKHQPATNGAHANKPPNKPGACKKKPIAPKKLMAKAMPETTTRVSTAPVVETQL